MLELKDGQAVPLTEFKQVIKDAGYDVTKAEVVAQSAADIRAGAAR